METLTDFIDCNNYENCPKLLSNPSLTKEIIVSNTDYKFKLAFFGCWGVYGKDGIVEEFDIKKAKYYKAVYGQQKVANKIKEYTRNNNVECLILAGDNIYGDTPNELQKEKSINIVKNIKKLKQEVSDEKTSKQIKKLEKELKNIKKELFNIDKQLEYGFYNTLFNLNVSNIFVGIGNHDIETCEILNKQINYKNWTMPALSYDYKYIIKNPENQIQKIIHLIFIDTNIYDKKYCNGEYPEYARKSQVKWIKSIIEKNNYNIIIGHIPFIANSHKSDKIGPRLEQDLFEDIKEIHDFANINMYICADEHNFQEIKLNSMPLQIIAGIGGTQLDNSITHSIKETIRVSPSFGFVSIEIDITNNDTLVDFHHADDMCTPMINFI